ALRVRRLQRDGGDRPLHVAHAEHAGRAIGDVAAADRARRARRLERGLAEMGGAAAQQGGVRGDDQPDPDHARPRQPRMLGDADPRLHHRSSREDDLEDHRSDESVQRGQSRQRRELRARFGQRRRHGRDQRRDQGARDPGDRLGAPHAASLRVGLVPLVRGRGVHHHAAGAVLAAHVRRHGADRHRHEGGDAAGRGLRRGHRRRRRHLHLERDREESRRRLAAALGLLPGAALDRQGRAVHVAVADHRRVHVAVLRAAVPGRHGPAAAVHVHGESLRRHTAPARARLAVLPLQPAGRRRTQDRLRSLTRMRLRNVVAIALALGAGSALAKVSPQEAAKLGAELTPIGAEKSGNKAGTIPEWTGGLVKKESPRGDNPFGADKPLYTITAANLKEHEANLTEGYKAIFRTFPDYKMNVYPTRRSASYPQWFYDATKKNATAVEITDNGFGFSGAAQGYPFPIPKNGTEVMWN